MRFLRFCGIFNSQLDYCVAELLEIICVEALVLGKSGKFCLLDIKIIIKTVTNVFGGETGNAY